MARPVVQEQSNTIMRTSAQSCMDYAKKLVNGHQIHLVIENDLEAERVTVRDIALQRGETGDCHDAIGARLNPTDTWQFTSYGRGGVSGTATVRTKEDHDFIIKFKQDAHGRVAATAAYLRDPDEPTNTLSHGIKKEENNKVVVKLSILVEAWELQKTQIHFGGKGVRSDKNEQNWGRMAAGMRAGNRRK